MLLVKIVVVVVIIVVVVVVVVVVIVVVVVLARGSFTNISRPSESDTCGEWSTG